MGQHKLSFRKMRLLLIYHKARVELPVIVNRMEWPKLTERKSVKEQGKESMREAVCKYSCVIITINLKLQVQ